MAKCFGCLCVRFCGASMLTRRCVCLDGSWFMQHTSEVGMCLHICVARLRSRRMGL